MTRKDALEILGLEADASLDEAKQAYRKLARHYHPDKNPAPNASVMFRYICDAWEYIQNDAKAEEDRRTGAEESRQQAEAKQRAKAEKARQQAEATRRQTVAKRRAARKRAEEERIFGFVVLFLALAAVIGGFMLSRTADKPGESSKPTLEFPPLPLLNSKDHIIRGKAKAARGEYFEAISDYDMAISRNPANAKTYHYRGEAKAKLGQYAAAILDYDKAISLDPDAIYAYNSRGWTKYMLGQHAAAIADYDTAIIIDSFSAYLYSNRARVKANWGKYDAAIADHDTAVRLAPNAAYTYKWRGWTKYRQGRYFTAITDYDSAILLDIDDARSYYYRGLAKEKIQKNKGDKDFRKALELAEKAKDWDLHGVIKRNMY